MNFSIIIYKILTDGEPARRGYSAKGSPWYGSLLLLCEVALRYVARVKVVLMVTKRLFFIVLLMIIGCQPDEMAAFGRPGQDRSIVESIIVGKSAESSQNNDQEKISDEQLDINKNALLKDPNELIRIKAASLMLFSDNPQARGFLIEILSQGKNSAARMAVCKSLIQTRTSKEPVLNKTEFIQPLLGVFDTDNDAEAQLAAEATLIFEYEEIEELLAKIVTDVERPAKTRINAIRALTLRLTLRPDMNATIRLIRLVDDPVRQVADEAEKALHSLGIPVGTNPKMREVIIRDLILKGRDAFLRDWLINQEAQMRQLRAELDSWQKSYLALLEKTYRSINDDTERGNFLVEYLGSPKADVKLWALGQVSQWMQGTNPNLPKELEPILISLISDQDKVVRRKTAELLALMRTLNSASPLLAQLKVETDEQVKGQLLDALGWVCFYALSPSASFKVSPEIRQQALNEAEIFLSDKDTDRAQIGARVMKKLLERNGLEPEVVDKKLNSLVERYNRLKDEPDEALQGGLLNAMAALVARDSACKAKAEKLFKTFFMEALSSKRDIVRETAVDGLSYIDETETLTTLRRKGFADDPSPNVINKLIELARRIGGKEDLNWLSGKLGANSESKLAWQAMLRIFNDSEIDLLKKWMDELTGDRSRISDVQKIAFLKIVESKAIGDDKLKVFEKLAELLYRTGQFEQAADYFERLRKSTKNIEEEKVISSKLLDAYLKWPNLELASELIENHLSEGDLDPNDVIMQSINNYLNNPPAGTDRNPLLKVLIGIESPSQRPRWREQIRYWTDRLRKIEDPNKPEMPVN